MISIEVPDFDTPPPVDPPPLRLVDDEFADHLDGLILGAKRIILACEHNGFMLMRRSEKYRSLYFDDFLHRIRLGDRDWSDGDTLEALRWLQYEHHVAKFSKTVTSNAVALLANSRKRDTLRDFVRMKLPVWDGVPRVEWAFCDGWGAAETSLNRKASANFFVALIARAMKPGAQVDTMWTFEGPQGAFKSRALRALGGTFHAEITAPIGTTDFMRELRGIWIAELSELESIRGKESTTIKRVLSAPNDRFVEKFEKHAETYARRAVAVATTNESHGYWQDPTGARRLVPIVCGEIRVSLIETNRLQWFAEALHLYLAGATWWDWPDTLKQLQEDRQQGDPWEDVLLHAIAHGRRGSLGVHESWPDGFILSATIMADWLRLEPSQQGGASGNRLGKVMRKLGFVPDKRGKARDQKRGWVWAGEGSPADSLPPPRSPQRAVQESVTDGESPAV